jgi:hypothetical protein
VKSGLDYRWFVLVCPAYGLHWVACDMMRWHCAEAETPASERCAAVMRLDVFCWVGKNFHDREVVG